MDAPENNPGDDATAPAPDRYRPSAVARARGLLDEMPARIGRYRILERIGGGGMGEVYVAEQTEPIKRRVAIKVIKAGMDTKQVVARFEAERQALAMMDHPNIARVFDAGATDTGRPYFVMELVRGVPITRFCDDNRLTTRQRVELLVPVCQAVQHAHQKGIIHRDIKPHNVLVTLHDGKPVPKVIDFGIAKATSQPLTDKTVYTEFRAMIGTPAYMSPEQAEMSGLDIDTRSDIYSLGVLAYELLTGAPPFDSDRLVKAGLGEIQRIIREEEPPRPSMRFSTLGAALTAIANHRGTEPARLSKLIAGELDWIVMRAMEKDRRRRYDTATDLAADFTRHLTGEPVFAAPPTWAYRTQKFVKRNKGAVVTAAAVTTALTLGVVGTTAMSFEAKHQAVLARQATTREAARADGEAKARDASDLESYIANLASAQSAMASGNWPEARTRLDACPESKRGWEWKFLRKQAGETKYRLRHAGIYGVSRDGSRALIYNTDTREMRVFDATTGRPSGAPLRGANWNSRGYYQLSPNGTLVFAFYAVNPFTTGENKWRCQIWDARSGEPMEDSASFDGNSIWEGPHLAVVAELNRYVVQIRAFPNGEKVGKAMTNSAAVISVGFSPDGGRLVTVCLDGSVRLWDVRTGSQIASEMTSLRFDHNDGTHTQWFKAPVSHVEFSPDGSKFLTSDGYVAQLWDGFSGRPMYNPIFDELGIHSATFIADGTKVLTTSAYMNCFRLWDVAAGMAAGERFEEHSDCDVAISGTDGTIVLGCANFMYFNCAPSGDYGIGGVALFAADGQKLGAIQSGGCEGGSPDGKTFFVQSEDVNGADDGVLFARSNDLDIAVDSLEDSAKKADVGLEIEAAIADSANTPPATPGGVKSGATASRTKDGFVRVDDSSAEPPARVGSPDGPIGVFTLSPDQTRLVTSDGGTIHFYGNGSWTELAVFRQDSEVRTLRFTPDGTRLIVQFAGGGAQIWDPRPLSDRQKMWARRAAERKPARDYVEKLMARSAKPEDLKPVIRGDATVTPLRKLVALEILDLEIHKRQREAEREPASTQPATGPATAPAR